MKKQTVRCAATVLATLALATGYAITGSAAKSFDEALQEYIKQQEQELREEFRASCEEGWYRSQASASCDFRSGGISMDGLSCVIRAQCRLEYSRGDQYSHSPQYVSTRWRGRHSEADDLRNCYGSLKVGAC